MSKEFGKTLSEGLRSIKARSGRLINNIESDIAYELGFSVDTIKYWRRGHVPTEDEQVAYLAYYIVRNGKLGRDWLQKFLAQARYFDPQRLLDELCPQSEANSGSGAIENLPPRGGIFVGRQEEQSRVIEGLMSRWPVVSIEGMGGIGKTSLAVEVARQCLYGGSSTVTDPFEACVFVTAKDNAVSLTYLLNTIGQVLQHPSILQKEPLEEKQHEVNLVLRRQRILLIVDNFEAIADLALVEYLQRIPEPSKVLVTSRYGRLRRVWDVPLRGLTDSEAVELIKQHVKRLGLSGLNGVKPEGFQSLISIVEGNPYALEMALGYLKYGKLSLDILVTGLENAGPLVSEVFEYIYAEVWGLLEAGERLLLLAIALFTNRGSKKAIEATVQATVPGLDSKLMKLAELSLIKPNAALEESHRYYTLHALTRAFAMQKLQTREYHKHSRELREQQARYYMQFLKEQKDRLMERSGKEQVLLHFLNEMDLEIDNIVNVCAWCDANKYWPDTLGAPIALLWYLEYRGNWSEQLHWSDKILKAIKEGFFASSTDELQRDTGALHLGKAWLLINRREYSKALNQLDNATAYFQAGNDKHSLAVAYRHRGVLEGYRKRFDVASEYYNRAMVIWQSLGDEREISSVLSNLGFLFLYQEQYDAAYEKFSSAATIRRKINDRRLSTTLRGLGNLEMARGNYDKAQEYYIECLHIAKQSHDALNLSWVYLDLAETALRRSRYLDAKRWGEESKKIFSQMGLLQERDSAVKIIDDAHTAMSSR